MAALAGYLFVSASEGEARVVVIKIRDDKSVGGMTRCTSRANELALMRVIVRMAAFTRRFQSAENLNGLSGGPFPLRVTRATGRPGMFPCQGELGLVVIEPLGGLLPGIRSMAGGTTGCLAGIGELRPVRIVLFMAILAGRI